MGLGSFRSSNDTKCRAVAHYACQAATEASTPYVCAFILVEKVLDTEPDYERLRRNRLKACAKMKVLCCN